MLELINWGYKPILAHMERYSFLHRYLDLFHQMLDWGVLMQVNASTIINDDMSSFIKAAIKKEMIHCFASDAHNMRNRKPNLKAAYDKIALDKGIFDRILNNDDSIAYQGSRLKKLGKLYF